MGNISVFGTYTSTEQLEAALGVARAAGFRDSDVSVLVPENGQASELEDIQPRSTARFGADVMISGGGLGSLTGAGTLMVPDMGPVLAAGPLLTALSKAQAETAVGDVISWLIGVGVPAYQAKRYNGLLQRGCILAALRADNAAWVGRAKQVLEGTGAKNLSEADEGRGAFAQYGKPKLRKAS
jgi:hypothetical protein